MAVTVPLLVDPTEEEAEDCDMKIVTLIENTTDDRGLCAEHGLSLYIEVGQRKILFDAGQSGSFADNAEKLGIRLDTVDTAVLSHGHYDHGNGLLRFFAENQTAGVYASKHVFEPHFNKDDCDIGLNPALKDSGRFVYVDEYADLGDGILLVSAPADPHIPIEHFGLKVQRFNQLEPEDFSHERYLLIQEGEKRICITGCAHKGILNIIHWFDPDVVIGGFHFKPLSPNCEMLHQAAISLAQKPRVYYTGHCTGIEQYEVLKETLGQRIHRISTGTIINL